MGGSKTASWVTGTALLALVLVAGGWFLLIGPVFATAGETRLQAQSVRESNEALAQRITKLAKQYENLEQYKAELAALRAQVPTTAQQSEYLRELQTIADANGVTLTTVTPSIPSAFTLVGQAAAAPAQDEEMSGAGVSGQDGETPADTATDPAAQPAAPAGPAVPAGMATVQLSMTAVGSYDGILAFVNALQTGTTRLFLLTDVQGNGQSDTEAGAGRPATAVGDLEVQLTGMVFVLPDSTTPVAPADPEVPAPALPGAVPNKNPMVPLGG
ncbi:hypothetical protein ACFO3K_08010 [Cellulomonas algicola]|uniref:hypothetical protein n=1 Tax=Cellulomonas algicola TaxID=2071633 RepID=UPI001C3FED43|nr:hypothetical protein [Cellulomonas algicola]